MFPDFTPPKTLTKDEQRRLLRVVRSKGSPRNLALLTLALGTGLVADLSLRNQMLKKSTSGLGENTPEEA